VDPSQLRHRVVAVLEEHSLVQLLGPFHGGRAARDGVARNLGALGELIEVEATQ
jgi:hypothetical protein